jgi:hypothetical protein
MARKQRTICYFTKANLLQIARDDLAIGWEQRLGVGKRRLKNPTGTIKLLSNEYVYTFWSEQFKGRKRCYVSTEMGMLVFDTKHGLLPFATVWNPRAA